MTHTLLSMSCFGRLKSENDPKVCCYFGALWFPGPHRRDTAVRWGWALPHDNRTFCFPNNPIAIAIFIGRWNNLVPAALINPFAFVTMERNFCWHAISCSKRKPRRAFPSNLEVTAHRLAKILGEERTRNVFVRQTLWKIPWIPLVQGDQLFNNLALHRGIDNCRSRIECSRVLLLWNWVDCNNVQWFLPPR